jgi:transcription elongation factor GreA
MNPTASYISQEKRNDLEKELVDLQTVKRKEILDALEFAKSLGDLSENAEYHQAREEQGKLEERIAAIEEILRNSVILKKHHSTTVEVGSTVVVQKTGDKNKQTFHIVGSEEADYATGKISNHSPLGIALHGKKPGDTAKFESPRGMIEYKVISIE